jgi:hypothetical protein
MEFTGSSVVLSNAVARGVWRSTGPPQLSELGLSHESRSVRLGSDVVVSLRRRRGIDGWIGGRLEWLSGRGISGRVRLLARARVGWHRTSFLVRLVD